MSLNFLTLDGSGLFIWPAYIFTFLCFISLYAKNKKALKKQEKMFLNEHKEFTAVKTTQIKQREVTKEILPISRAI